MTSLSFTRRCLSQTIRHSPSLVCTRGFASLSTPNHTTPSKHKRKQLHFTSPTRCWNISCRYYSQQNSGDNTDNTNSENQHQKEQEKPNHLTTEQPDESDQHHITEASVEELVKTSEEEFIKYSEELSQEQMMFHEAAEQEASYQNSEMHFEEYSKLEQDIQDPAFQQSSSFENYLVVRNTPPGCLPSDVQRAFYGRFGIVPKLYSFVSPYYHSEVVWLVELNSKQQAKDIFENRREFRLGLNTLITSYFGLQALPTKYEGKAVLVTIGPDVKTGDLSGFFQDFGVLSVEQLARGRFVVKVDSEESAQAIVLMYHQYPYAKTIMGVHMLY